MVLAGDGRKLFKNEFHAADGRRSQAEENWQQTDGYDDEEAVAATAMGGGEGSSSFLRSRLLALLLRLTLSTAPMMMLMTNFLFALAAAKPAVNAH